MPKGCGGESWLEQYKRLKQPLGVPQLDGGAYLLDAMFRLRPTRSNGMAERATDWDQIEAFARVTGRISEPWEAEVLFDMCQGYLAARQAGEDPLAVAPVDQV